MDFLAMFSGALEKVVRQKSEETWLHALEVLSWKKCRAGKTKWVEATWLKAQTQALPNSCYQPN